MVAKTGRVYLSIISSILHVLDPVFRHRVPVCTAQAQNAEGVVLAEVPTLFNALRGSHRPPAMGMVPIPTRMVRIPNTTKMKTLIVVASSRRKARFPAFARGLVSHCKTAVAMRIAPAMTKNLCPYAAMLFIVPRSPGAGRGSKDAE